MGGAGGDRALPGLLRALRRRAKLTQQQLADLAGLGVRTIIDIERGRVTRPQRASVRLLADALGLDGETRAAFERAASGASQSMPEIESHARPSQLPSDLPDFAGRGGLVGTLGDLLTNGPPAPVAVISGPPGIGKTALATHVGHILAPHFPDGQLFVDLRGTEARPLTPFTVLGSFLRALGVETHFVPAELHERLALYRTVLADRQVLVVLDNALCESAVRPLLASGPACATVITSRVRLAGLEGAATLPVGVLDPADAAGLLASLTGPERLAAEPEAAARVTELCGYLPLAVRIAGARLAARPTWPIARLAALLRSERRRIDELTAGDLAVGASLGSGYRGLSSPARRALRLLASLGVSEFATWVGGPLLGLPGPRAEALIEQLVDAGLLDAGGGGARYRLHDLVRVFAQARAEEEDAPEEVCAAVRRAAAAWLDGMRSASARLPPEASAWFEVEEEALVALVETTARHGLHRLAGEISDLLASSHLAPNNKFASWERSHRAALRAARESRDRHAEAAVLARLGHLRWEQDRFLEAAVTLRAALATFAELADQRGQAATLVDLGMLLRETANFDTALEHLEDAESLYRSLRDDEGLAHVAYGGATVHREQGRDTLAAALLMEALDRYRAFGDRRREALALRGLGLVHRARGELGPAAELCRRALDLLIELGDRLHTTYASQSLAKVAIRQGRYAEAEMRLGTCLESSWSMEDRFGLALTLRTIGELQLAQGALPEAAEHLVRADELWKRLGLPLWRARTGRDLAAVQLLSGAHERAHETWARSEAIFTAVGSREANELTGWREHWGCWCELPAC